jgi:hypothetical protein
MRAVCTITAAIALTAESHDEEASQDHLRWKEAWSGFGFQ